MAKKIKQYVLNAANKADFASGNFQYPILQLGVQGLPGTRLQLNKAPVPVIIGYTGVFELNFDNQPEITDLRFNPDDLDKNINATQLIVDIIYSEEG